MRIQPRQQILDIWQSVLRASFHNGTWIWVGRDEPNSISDAEQLLCLLYPAIELPDARPADGIPRVLADYLERYTDENDEPVFAAGSYLRAETGQVTEAQQALAVVDSYATSVRLSLAALAFLKVSPTATDTLDRGFQKRLTGAMSGLLNSFVASDEPGWAWGIVRPDGVADPRTSLYFTLSALESINELNSDRTRILGLATDTQLGLSQTLQLHALRARRYWASVARAEDSRWPLEDIPWRTPEGEESDYFTLLVSALLVPELTAGDDPIRVAGVLEELSSRGRITRRVLPNEPAVALHVPGVPIRLDGTEALGPRLYWQATDFAPLLFTHVVRAAIAARRADLQDRLVQLAELVLDHLMLRRISHGPAAGLWDDPREVLRLADQEPVDKPSWNFTVRVVEALGAAAGLTRAPLSTTRLMSMAREMLAEADQLLDLGYAEIEQSDLKGALLRARRLLTDRPGTAMAMVGDVLRRLDTLAKPQIVPVSIHLDSDANASEVEQAVLGVLYAFGFMLDEAQSPVAGSWIRSMTAQLKEKFSSGDVLARIERALEMQALDKPQSEIDSAQADAVAKLITALSQDRNAFVQIGSVFLIKVDGVTVVRNLTQQEMAFLQRHTGMLASPQKILQALEDLAANAERPPGLAIEEPEADTG